MAPLPFRIAGWSNADDDLVGDERNRDVHGHEDEHCTWWLMLQEQPDVGEEQDERDQDRQAAEEPPWRRASLVTIGQPAQPTTTPMTVSLA